MPAQPFPTYPAQPAVPASLEGVSVWTPERKVLLRDLDWTIRAGERWTILGPNGAGKTTLLSLIAGERHPSAGTVTLFGETLGRTDLRDLRQRIGKVDPAARLLEWMTGREAVLTGIRNTLRPTWREITPEECDLADDALASVGAEALADRELTTFSQGERQRVRIARALIRKPSLLLLDEPATGLDFPAREALLAALDRLTSEDSALPLVMISHHLEEIPASNTHVMLLRDGAILHAGPVADVLTDDKVSETFGFPISVRSFDGRWYARAAAGWQVAGADDPALQ